MNLQWIGAILIIVGCGGVGFGMALRYRQEVSALDRLAGALAYMAWELECRMTALPELCKMASEHAGGCVGRVLADLARELETQVSPQVSSCMTAALRANRDLPEKAANVLEELGRSLGRFDLAGQLQGLETVKDICRRQLEELEKGSAQRLRGYQTLGLCAGAALAILLV